MDNNVFLFDIGNVLVDFNQGQLLQGIFDAMEIAPGQCVFFDDSSANVAGARAIGMNALQFVPEHYDAIKRFVQGFLE